MYARISDSENEIYVRRISLFEVAIKLKIGGRLNLRRGLAGLILDCKNEAIEILPITNDHLLAYDQVPFFEDHRDPFDRLILATALAERIPIILADEKFSRYSDVVDVIW
ncbi:type II toxin-antitoxin system VapC family toxin [Spirosoma pollinicola]|uniref:PIN domain-containing protein n=1 Tax=Spirosoma pollinicola TaxID=2057025 RepID=A0A2K8YXT0_9BACT|nr:type II toxin-antitoxin system VapC family toxin [Spirosoma pollinicola]AUD02435.1 PIN domain-containing protein [Spirosoma pollinicola]